MKVEISVIKELIEVRKNELLALRRKTKDGSRDEEDCNMVIVEMLLLQSEIDRLIEKQG